VHQGVEVAVHQAVAVDAVGAVAADGDLDLAGRRLLHPLTLRLRQFDQQAGLPGEGGGHHEKDQQEEHHVDQGREVDAVVGPGATLEFHGAPFSPEAARSPWRASTSLMAWSSITTTRESMRRSK